jgi:hypothetical protein
MAQELEQPEVYDIEDFGNVLLTQKDIDFLLKVESEKIDDKWVVLLFYDESDAVIGLFLRLVMSSATFGFVMNL